jgi:hypothetical protein
MDIKIETIYGMVNLKSCYDCDSSSDFYDTYDENDHHLGELWNLPYFDEDDEESLECLRVALETAIEGNDICMPSVEEDEDEDNTVCLLTILERIGHIATAQSHAFSDMEKCRESKIVTVQNYVALLVDHNVKYEVRDADVICEVESDDKSRYLCVTMRRAEIN